MKTIVDFENLVDNKKHIIGEGYEIGELSEKSAMNLVVHKGWKLQGGELCGRFDGVDTFVTFLENNGGKFGSRKLKPSFDSSHETRYGSWVKFPTYEEASKAVKTKPETFRHFDEADLNILVNSNDRLHGMNDIDEQFEFVENKIETEGVKRGDDYAILA